MRCRRHRENCGKLRPGPISFRKEVGLLGFRKIKGTWLSLIDRASAAHTTTVNFQGGKFTEKQCGTPVVAAAAGSINFGVKFHGKETIVTPLFAGCRYAPKMTATRKQRPKQFKHKIHGWHSFSWGRNICNTLNCCADAR